MKHSQEGQNQHKFALLEEECLLAQLSSTPLDALYGSGHEAPIGNTVMGG